jgi:hypothetical protein
MATHSVLLRLRCFDQLYISLASINYICYYLYLFILSHDFYKNTCAPLKSIVSININKQISINIIICLHCLFLLYKHKVFLIQILPNICKQYYICSAPFHLSSEFLTIIFNSEFGYSHLFICIWLI